MKYCPKCKTEYPDAVAMCPLDGTTLQSTHPNDGIKCPTCGVTSTPGAVYCTNCGAKLESPPSLVMCPQCGEMVDANSNFCPKCGYHFSGHPTPGPLEFPSAPVASEAEEGVVLYRYGFLGAHEGSSANTNDFDPRFDPEARLKAAEFNTMRLKVIRANELLPGKPVSPEVLQAVTNSVDSYISSLRNDSGARDFLPYATQAAAYWLHNLSGLPADSFGAGEIEALHLPQKYKALLGQPEAADVVPTSYLYMTIPTFWPPEVFFLIETAFGKNVGEFANVVCQSLRELYYLTYPTMELRKRFLSEEDSKLNHGYYPDSIKKKVGQVLSALRNMHQKWEQQLSSSPDAEENLLLTHISPLSVPGLAMLNLGTRNFTQGEQEIFEAYQTYGIDFPALLIDGYNIKSFLRKFLQEQDANAKGVGTGNPAYVIFDMAYFYLWRYNNILSHRQFGEQGYNNMPPLRAPLMPGMTWEQLAQAMGTMSNENNNSPSVDQELVSALLGRFKTIETLYWEITAARAKP